MMVSEITSGRPVTRLTVPLGAPASMKHLISSTTAPVPSSAGLVTMVQPVPSAGAIFRACSTIGEIPGGERADDTNGLIDRHETIIGGAAGKRAAEDPPRLIGEPVDQLDRGPDFRLGLAKRLAAFQGQLMGNLLGTLFQQLCRLAQNLGALPGRNQTPALEGLMGCVDRGVDIGAVGLRRLGHLFLRRRIDDVDGAAGHGWLPLTVDIKFRRQHERSSVRHIQVI